MKGLARRCWLVCLGMAATAGWADVQLPAIIGSNMVVQAGQPVPIWGRAGPGEQITVKFAGRKAAAVADEAGAWRVTLPALPASDRPEVMTVTGRNRITLKNVLVGEVWLCSGQSNMTLALKQTDNAEAAAAAARHPTIRLFTVARQAVEAGPQWDCKGRWVECTPETAAEFSAVGYYFGRELPSVGRAGRSA